MTDYTAGMVIKFNAGQVFSTPIQIKERDWWGKVVNVPPERIIVDRDAMTVTVLPGRG